MSRSEPASIPNSRCVGGVRSASPRWTTTIWPFATPTSRWCGSSGILVESGVVDDADVLRLARLMSSLFSRLVDAQLDVLALGVGADDEPGTDPERRLAELAAADVDIFAFMEKTMAYVWRRHLLGAIGHRLSVDNTEQGQAVAFADLSGFARFTKRATADEIARVIDTFEAVAFDVVSGHEGRVVKLIGDEVLFVVDTLDERSQRHSSSSSGSPRSTASRPSTAGSPSGRRSRSVATCSGRPSTSPVDSRRWRVPGASPSRGTAASISWNATTSTFARSADRTTSRESVGPRSSPFARAQDLDDDVLEAAAPP